MFSEWYLPLSRVNRCRCSVYLRNSQSAEASRLILYVCRSAHTCGGKQLKGSSGSDGSMELSIHRTRRILGSAAICLLVLCGFLAGLSVYRLQRGYTGWRDLYEYLKSKGLQAPKPSMTLQQFIRNPYTGTPAIAAMLAGLSGAACVLVRRRRSLLERGIKMRTATKLMVLGLSVLSVSLVFYVIGYLDFHAKVFAPDWYDSLMFWITLIAGIVLIGAGIILQYVHANARAHVPTLGRAHGNGN